ncbi:C1orf27 family protein [Megaselia abdita]
MLPGCFYILGLFVVSKEPIFESDQELSAMKNHLQDLIKLINEHSSLCGSSPSMPTNKLLLSYSTRTKQTICKTFEPKEEGGGFFMPVDWKYLDKHTEWHKFETTYEVDEVFPLIIDEEHKVNIEDNLYMCMNLINTYIKNTEVFFLNEDVDENQMLETFLKRNYSELGSVDAISASIFQSTFISDPSNIQIKKFRGSIKFKGVISCRVWSHPKNTFREIKQFIHHDILRSIAARTQTYCDGLADPTIGDNDDFYISEPPRRVYFDIPDSNGLQFSEYIFHGELPIVAAAQAKEMMDLSLDTDKIHADLESDMDENTFALHPKRQSSSGTSVEQREIGRNMYIIGIVVAILVLLASILMHFIMK